MNSGRADGVVLEDGTEIRAKAVLSNATPEVTFLDLLPEVWYQTVTAVLGTWTETQSSILHALDFHTACTL